MERRDLGRGVPVASPVLDSEILIASELPHMARAESCSDDEEPAPAPARAARSSRDEEGFHKLLSELDYWTFDIFQLKDDDLPKIVEQIFKELCFFEYFPLDVRKLRAFTRAMMARYQPNPYHNFRHACDVLHAVYLILTITEGGKKFTHLEKFALALAALCHDVDHPGLTNAFLIATSDPLALRYNDRTVLENHHAATSFITMRGHDNLNLLDGLNEVEQRHVRKLMLTIILATDMEAHSRILREMTDRLARPEPFELSPPYTPPGSLSPLREEFSSMACTPVELSAREHPDGSQGGTVKDERVAAGNSKPAVVKVYKNPLQSAPPITSSNDVILLLQMIIKCADLSNVVKPFFLSKRWAALLLLEWFRQGEIEKQLGLPISKFMDREDPMALMAMTCGCIDYVAKPMYEATAQLLPKLHEEVLANLSFNRQMWTQFSTNGRRASETAQQILGPFAPPPIPKMVAPDEGKLVATFNGQYVSTDVHTNDKSPRNLREIAEPDGLESIDTDSENSFAKVEEEPTVATAQLPEVIREEERPSTAVAAQLPEVSKQEASPSTFVALQLPEVIKQEEHPSTVAALQLPEVIKQEEHPSTAVAAQLPDVIKQEEHLSESDRREQDLLSDIGDDHASTPEMEIHKAVADAEISSSAMDSDAALSSPASSIEHPQALDGHHQVSASELDTDVEADRASQFPGHSEGGEPLSLLFGVPNNEGSLILSGKPGTVGEPVSLVPGLLPSANLLIVDRNKKSIDAFRVPAHVVAPSTMRPPSFKSGVLEADTEKGKVVVPQTQIRVGFWGAIRTHPRVARLNRALDSNVWNSVFIVATLFALFADDVVKGFLPKEADVYEAHLLTACLVLFLSEAVILSIFRDAYFLSFFFWLDLLGTLTLIPLIIGISSQNLVLARTGRAAKTITRASKLLQASHIQAQFARCLPVVRLLKFVGQYKDSSPIDPEYEEDEHVSSKPSQLWTRLSELTTQKLILGVLIIIILYPYFVAQEKDLGPVVSLNGLDFYPFPSADFTACYNRVTAINDDHGYSIEYLGVRSSCMSPPENPTGSCTGVDLTQDFVQLVPDPAVIPDGRRAAISAFRPAELISVTSDSERAEAFYSIRKRSKIKYGMNIAMTIIILSILALWCFSLSRDSNYLLIQPIERMVQFVKELAEDPVSFAGKTIAKPTGDKTKVMETFFVEAALVKIASLTKVALGDAGMDILSVNLKGAEFNPMLPGKKIRACFGFCDIRNFTDATECLQEDVMMFVNRIADVVHNKVVLHSGFPNKNIGDAFLIVWKKTVSDNTNKSRATSFADRALRSFLDIIQCIETSQSLAEFAKHPAIQKRMPGYRIHMGFGLHVGWAIEGAIGSAHKVDPSYLSPHVNMASRLEAATKQYGVMLLISETVIAHLTKSSLRDNCRKLDRVTVKGSKEPLVLYTFDIPLFQQDLRGNPAEYRDLFEEAVDNYIEGEWATAVEKLEECLSMWPTDKPATVLLNVMAVHNYIAPEDWQGYRELTEK